MNETSRSLVSADRPIAFPRVHYLPTEILCETFQIVLSSAEAKQYYPQLQCLSAVCRRWWDVVDQFPLFWSRFQQCDGPTLWEKALEKSSSYPLDVWFQGALYELQNFLHQLRPHMDRCRRIRLSYDGAGFKTEDVFEPLFLPAASLETFHLVDEAGWNYLNKMELFGGQAHSLKEVKLTGIVCDWRSGVFSGLTVLHISWGTFPTLGHLSRVLKRCNDLQQLELTYNEFEGDESDPSAWNPVDLPQLRHLSVGFLTAAIPSSFLTELSR
ncbi:hypothetical protein FRC01_011094 [Tulasnella sp. 417]|nr:hypothetical protein FRC01_011094 [Tulasnella sp. 417]